MDADAAVVGAGAVGLSTALALAAAGRRVLVLEKERAPGLHQSGRNSGVIHPGYNLKPGSEKARFCVEGSRRLRAYCAERGVAVVENGILVVARTAEEAGRLDELERRGRANGVPVARFDADGIRRLEPAVAGVAALHAPTGASLDTVAYVHALEQDLLRAGGEVRYGTRVHTVHEDAEGVTVLTARGPVRARVLVNAAGLQADRLARRLAPDLRIVPFRGEYAELVPARRHLVRGHVYGAPDLAFPFLGVHLSPRTDGRVVVGPGAVLALGREAYTPWRANARDLAATATWPGFWRLAAQPDFRRLARAEAAKSLRLGAVAAEAARLVPSLARRDLTRAFAGNRAQAVDRTGRLVEDMVVRTTQRAVHILNAVSPGLTASLPFGEHVAKLALERLA